MTRRLFILFLLYYIFVYSTTTANDVCTEIESTFQKLTEKLGEPQACRCLPEEMGGSRDGRSFGDTGDNVWIGCTRQNMPSVFRALNALNETLITHLWIWDSLINILPNDMFSKVRPKVLTIENSEVSVFRKGAFSNIGRRLKSLHLKNNILKMIEKETFAELSSLQTLDLSGNKISVLTKGVFDHMPDLETLMLADNQISHIEDGVFNTLTNLRILNLANNKFTNITKDTFKGLHNLEKLSLNGNHITNVDWSAFSQLKRLRILDMGTNHLTQRLYLNNNSIQSLRKLSLRDLPNLSVLSVDRNQISYIADSDLTSLSRSSRLSSLSLAENNISRIESNALEHVHQITALSLQNNELSSLRSTLDKGMTSFLRPLKKLRSLFLSRNNIEVLDDGDLNFLTALRELSLDHNRIEKINNNALKGMRLQKLFLNNNHLYYLPENTFEDWKLDELQAIDLSDNYWECICGREWLGDWLSKLGDKNFPSGDLGCLQFRCDTSDTSQRSQQSMWITIVASILAVVALIFLVAIGFLYVQENCFSPIPLKRVPSDMVRLIPSMESLSYPNPIVSTNIKVIKEPVLTKHRPEGSSSTEKKRVRFDGI
uniref:Uncharacterized protein n=1 Tax=Acrobeloides nanus TaxID=290746 RepID=A0A914DUG8_9BILA